MDCKEIPISLDLEAISKEDLNIIDRLIQQTVYLDREAFIHAAVSILLETACPTKEPRAQFSFNHGLGLHIIRYY